jgi:peptidase M50B-like protein
VGISGAVTALLYAVPVGRTLAWPLVLLSTLAHELGHGIAAALLGGHFQSLVIYADGSGMAQSAGSFGRVATAVVAGAGLVGPAAAALALLALGRRERWARGVLVGLGAALLALAIFRVRNVFGFWFVVSVGGLLLFVATRAVSLAQTVIVLLAVQLGLSVFSRSDYLFTPTALTAAGRLPSDVSVMASALFLPYWFWGFVCGSTSVGLLVWGIKVFFRR